MQTKNYLTTVLEMQEAGKTLTVEQLRRMLENSPIIGAAVTVSDCGVLCCGVLDERADDGVCVSIGTNAEWLKEKDYGKEWIAYAYPQTHIDREQWETCIECKSCDNCKNSPNVVEAVFGECAQCVSMSQFSPTGFCHSCGRPLTDEAWDELERRIESCR